MSLKRPEVPATRRGGRRQGARQGPGRRFPTMAAFDRRARGAASRTSGGRGHRRDRDPPRDQTGARGGRAPPERSPASRGAISSWRPGRPRCGGDRGRSSSSLSTIRAHPREAATARSITGVIRVTAVRPTTPRATATRTTARFRSRPTGTRHRLADRALPHRELRQPQVRGRSRRRRGLVGQPRGRSRSPRDSPGYTAVIKTGDSPSGPFADDSSSRLAGTDTTFALNGATARYYLIWITNLGPADQVSVNEVTAK